MSVYLSGYTLYLFVSGRRTIRSYAIWMPSKFFSCFQ